MRWLADGPIAMLDTETTSQFPEQARVVEICLALRIPGRPTDVRTTIVDPGIEVPEDAAKIHGLTTDRVRAEGKPANEVLDLYLGDIALAIRSGLVLVIQNAPYDLTVLDREARRHNLPTIEDRLGGPIAPVIDPLVLDKYLIRYRKRVSATQGARTLQTLAQVHRVPWDDRRAHGAEYDALQGGRVVYQIAKQTQMSHDELVGRGYHPNDCRKFVGLANLTPMDLHQAQIRWYAEQSESLAQYWRRTANEKRHDAATTTDDAERATALEDAALLDARADSVTTDWPLIPLAPARTKQEALMIP